MQSAEVANRKTRLISQSHGEVELWKGQALSKQTTDIHAVQIKFVKVTG